MKPLEALLVEDDVENRELVLHFLSKSNVHFEFAENGEKAIAKVKERPFDLILMDLKMPVMDGFQATGEIRKLERRENRPKKATIVAVTALTSPSEVERALAVGCNFHISKPARRNELVRLVEFIFSHLNSSA